VPEIAVYPAFEAPPQVNLHLIHGILLAIIDPKKECEV
jgi:hypothetical protein